MYLTELDMEQCQALIISLICQGISLNKNNEFATLESSRQPQDQVVKESVPTYDQNLKGLHQL